MWLLRWPSFWSVQIHAGNRCTDTNESNGQARDWSVERQLSGAEFAEVRDRIRCIAAIGCVNLGAAEGLHRTSRGDLRPRLFLITQPGPWAYMLESEHPQPSIARWLSGLNPTLGVAGWLKQGIRLPSLARRPPCRCDQRVSRPWRYATPPCAPTTSLSPAQTA